jgi:hypothetical protein
MMWHAQVSATGVRRLRATSAREVLRPSLLDRRQPGHAPVDEQSLDILGVVTGAADFNPGAKSDVQGNLPGIFITRFAY